MDWANERYVRVFTRDTPEWLCMDWQGRALWPHLLRKADRSGVIATKLGAKGISALVALPIDVVTSGIAALLADGCLREHETGFLIPNFLEAQETPQSDAQRQRDSRERRRDFVSAGLREDQRRNVVYFVRGESGGPIKIGQTDDISKRLVSLQSGHPDTLVLLATQAGERADEKTTHERFSHLRIRGEWFRPDDELLSYIEGLRDVTKRDESHAVTRGHTPSQPVTPDQTRPVQSVYSPSETRARELAELVAYEINRLARRNYAPDGEGLLKDCRRLAKERRSDEDVLLVIRDRAKEWVGCPKMGKHFIPKTLLRPGNFPGYLEDARAKQPRAPVLALVPVDDEPDLSYQASPTRP